MKKELALELAKHKLMTGGADITERNGVAYLNALSVKDGSANIPRFVNIVGNSDTLGGLPRSRFTVNIPSEVCMINAHAFQGSRIAEVVCDVGSLQTIGVFCFADSKIEKVSLPYGISSISAGAFSGCLSLHELDLPDTVSYIGNRAFSGSSLESIVIPNRVSDVGYDILSGCPRLRSVTWNSFCDIPCRAFIHSTLSEVKIYDGVECILESAFAYCTHLKKIAIPMRCCSIKRAAFEHCTALEEVIFSDMGVDYREICKYAFEGCVSLKQVNLEGRTHVGEMAFIDCKKLEIVELDDATILSEASGAFQGCNSLHTVRLMHDLPCERDGLLSGDAIDWLNELLNKEVYGICDEVQTEHRKITFDFPTKTYNLLWSHHQDLLDSNWYTIVDGNTSYIPV